MGKTAKELGKMAHEINENARKNKLKFTRPNVVNEYSKGNWEVDKWGETIHNGKRRICAFSRQGTSTSEQNKIDARLIVQAPKMHEMCQALFDMINHTDSMYLPIVAKILNDINPK